MTDQLIFDRMEYNRRRSRARRHKLNKIIPNPRRGQWTVAEDVVVLRDDITLIEKMFMLNRTHDSINARLHNLGREHRPLCTVSGCKNHIHSIGLCKGHAVRFKRHGGVLEHQPIMEKGINAGLCHISDCDRKAKATGLCAAHYSRLCQVGSVQAHLPIGAKQPQQAVCAVDGCGKRSHAKGWCKRHYKKVVAYGDPYAVAPRRSREPLINLPQYEPALRARFWAQVDKTSGPNGCWTWQGASKEVGAYGSAWPPRRLAMHWHHIDNGIATGVQGLFVNRLCDTDSCLNPQHLRAARNTQTPEREKRPNTRNTSGITGVTRNRAGAWMVHATHNYKSYYGGTYATPKAADVAARALREHLRIHGNADTFLTDMQSVRTKKRLGQSGVRHVSWKSQEKLWVVEVKKQSGGRYKNLADAINAARELRAKLGVAIPDTEAQSEIQVLESVLLSCRSVKTLAVVTA